MSLRGEIHIFEKAAWIAIIFALIVAEVIAIKRSDDESARQRIEQASKLDALNKQTEGINSGLQQSITTGKNQYDSTIGHVDSVLSKTQEAADTAREAVNNITGGKSFLVLERSWGQNRTAWIAYERGAATLHGVSVEITDLDQVQDFINQHRYNFDYFAIPKINTALGDFSPTVSRIFDIGVLPQPRTARLNMNFFALNGSWQERYVCREIDGEIKVAIRVTREKRGKNKNTNETIFTTIQKGFPVNKQGLPLDENGAPMWEPVP